MGKISAELVGNSVVVTRFESNGFIIPDKISQERKIISIINNSIDKENEEKENVQTTVKLVARGDFIYKLLSASGGNEDLYIKYCKGLYSEKDMKKGITWAEVAYLLYYVGGLDRSLKWGSIKPIKGYRVCVLQELSNGAKIVNEKLALYKNRLDMEYYIKAIIRGERYIPLPLYCSYIDLLNRKEDIEADISIEDMFRKVYDWEFERIFG